MNNKKALILSSTLTLAVVGTAVGVFGSDFKANFASVRADEVTTVLNQAKLQSVLLSNYDLKDKTGDKKFTIELDDGKYIEGAILMQNCQHQSTGATLGDYLTLDNSAQTGPNNASFNIFLNVHGIKHISFTWDVSFDALPEEVDLGLRSNIKTSDKGANGLYAALENEAYSYEHLIAASVGGSPFYTTGGSLDFIHPTQGSTGRTGIVQEFYQDEAAHGKANLVSLHPDAFGVPAGITYNVLLKSISITYYC